MNSLDVTGLSCPEPVVRTLAALKQLAAGETLVVVADTATARDNILRTAGQIGYAALVDTEGKEYRLTLKKP